MRDADRVAIVGMGVVLPGAHDLDTAWQSLAFGHPLIERVPEELWSVRLSYDPQGRDVNASRSALGAFVRDFEFRPADFNLPPVVGIVLDISQRVSMVAARRALADAGIHGPTAGVNGAVILGNLQGGAQKKGESWFRASFNVLREIIAGLPAFELMPEPAREGFFDELRRAWIDQLAEPTSDSLPGLLGNLSAARIAHYYDFTGPTMVVDAACASSLAGLEHAVAGLRSHRFDLAVSGGTDMQMDVPSYTGFSLMGALSDTGSFPFDARADGFVMGEGAVAFVLKRLADARRDGDRIHAVVRGIGSSSDGRGRSVVAPNPEGQIRAMERAYRDAGVDPTAIGFIEAHGTATPLGDPTEVYATSRVFAAAPRHGIPMASVKGNIGHLKGAAGAAGILRAVLAMHHRTIPAQAGFERPNPNCRFADAPLRIPTTAEPFPEGAPRMAAVSAFGFGGVNYHVVLEEGDGRDPGLPAVVSRGPPRLEGAIERRSPQVVRVPPSAQTEAVRRAPPQSGDGPLEALLGDGDFWRFASRQGPAVLGSLVSSYLTARAMFPPPRAPDEDGTM